MAVLLISGANGQVGQELRGLAHGYPDWEFVFTDIEELDICKTEALQKAFTHHQPQFFINCAAYTAVDKAETETELALGINAHAVASIAKMCEEFKTTLVHLSSDYVYHNTCNRPLQEGDPTHPQSMYAKSKLEGDLMALENCTSTYVIRSSWIYSSFGHNFVKTMLRLGKERDSLGVVCDQIGTPTYAFDLAKTLLAIVEYDLGNSNSRYGIYHYSNSGVCSWFDFAKAIFELTGMSVSVNPIPTSAYPTPAKRPFYSVLDTSKIQHILGQEIPYWRNSLKKCLAKLGAVTR